MSNSFQYSIGVIGLGAMGRSLALNIEEKCGGVVVYNRPHSGEKPIVDSFVNNEARGHNILAAHTLQEFTNHIKTPRTIILMISAGKAVDEMINRLTPMLNDGDTIIDAGNSNYRDTARRCEYLEQKNILFVGAGVSGGTDGARHGASVMLGGNTAAREKSMKIFEKIAAHDSHNKPCCGWFGSNGAGHFIKTIHNGIEYAIMQLIAESYALLQHSIGNNKKIAEIYEIWNKGRLGSFLIECTANILHHYTSNGELFIDTIRDKVSEKGTGRISIDVATSLNSPFTLTSEALNARFLSQQTLLRSDASMVFPGNIPLKTTPEAIQQALYASIIIAYAQGFELLYKASEEGIISNFEQISQVWQQGCIIRSSLLRIFTPIMSRLHPHGNLLLTPLISAEIRTNTNGWRQVVSQASTSGIAIPCMAAALSYFDGLRCKRSTAMLIEAQRDYFGTHGYERADKEANARYHYNWQNTNTEATNEIAL